MLSLLVFYSPVGNLVGVSLTSTGCPLQLLREADHGVEG